MRIEFVYEFKFSWQMLKQMFFAWIPRLLHQKLLPMPKSLCNMLDSNSMSYLWKQLYYLLKWLHQGDSLPNKNF